MWAGGTGACTDKAGFSMSGTLATLDALNTSLNTAHGAGSWATATGFWTHSAAAVGAGATRAWRAKRGFDVGGGDRRVHGQGRLLDERDARHPGRAQHEPEHGTRCWIMGDRDRFLDALG